MSRFYIPKGSVREKEISVSGEEAHHILDVMRLKKLDAVTAFDGEGMEYSGFIKSVGRNSLVIQITSEVSTGHPQEYPVTLIQAIPKKDNMDYIVEKATELGVTAILPVVTERTIVRWNDQKRHDHAERWRAISREAAKQCGRTVIPRIEEIKKFTDALSAAEDKGLKLIAALTDKAVDMKKKVSGFKGGAITLAIGPEGDFTPGEIEAAEKHGFKAVSLGRRVLKSDTAGLAAIAALNYEFDI